MKTDKDACIKNLAESLEEGAEAYEEIGGFAYEGQQEQFIRDVRAAAVKLREQHETLKRRTERWATTG